MLASCGKKPRPKPIPSDKAATRTD
jgi:hypothetical protein